METAIDDGKIKELIKQAIIEAIEEKKDIVHDLLMEVMDDLAMIRAIEEGEDSGNAGREEIFNILDGKEGSA
jgi:signal transduction histidine kinase